MSELDRLPLLAPARARLAVAPGDEPPSLSVLVLAVESDLCLALRVMGLANRGRARRTVASIPQAVRQLGWERLAALAAGAGTADVLDEDESQKVGEATRLHALSVHRVAGRLCELIGFERPDELLAAALLHDVGKLVMPEPDSGRPGRTPEQRLADERARHGTDHCRLGAELAAMVGLPEQLAHAIAQHHESEQADYPGLVRLADMLAQYQQGGLVDIERIISLSETLGIERAALSELLYELPFSIAAPPRAPEPCPLSDRELEVLTQLADGKVVKQIGQELGLSTSTVRSHLHRIYTRIGAADRTQAVLAAREYGWI